MQLTHFFIGGYMSSPEKVEELQTRIRMLLEHLVAVAQQLLALYNSLELCKRIGCPESLVKGIDEMVSKIEEMLGLKPPTGEKRVSS